MPTVSIQTSFVSGELSPGLIGHTDLAKYHSGAFLMQNWFVDVKGGASTRPGTQYIGTATSVGIWFRSFFPPRKHICYYLLILL